MSTYEVYSWLKQIINQISDGGSDLSTYFRETYSQREGPGIFSRRALVADFGRRGGLESAVNYRSWDQTAARVHEASRRRQSRTQMSAVVFVVGKKKLLANRPN